MYIRSLCDMWYYFFLHAFAKWIQFYSIVSIKYVFQLPFIWVAYEVWWYISMAGKLGCHTSWNSWVKISVNASNTKHDEMQETFVSVFWGSWWEQDSLSHLVEYYYIHLTLMPRKTWPHIHIHILYLNHIVSLSVFNKPSIENLTLQITSLVLKRNLFLNKINVQ